MGSGGDRQPTVGDPIQDGVRWPGGQRNGSIAGGHLVFLMHSTHPGWISNAYLVADRERGTAIAVDSGAPLGPVFDALETHGLRLAAVLTTHRHADHVAGHPEIVRRTGATVYALRGEADSVPGAIALEDGERREWDGIRVTTMALPGHTVHHAGFLIEDVGLFSGDCLFAGSVGGCSNPAAAPFDALRGSIVERILTLPDDTPVYPGHAGATTVGRERTTNPFVRVMTGLDAPGTTPCAALGRAARLIVLARDYDGTTKAWVRFQDAGTDLILDGRRVEIHIGIPREAEKPDPRDAGRPRSKLGETIKA